MPNVVLFLGQFALSCVLYSVLASVFVVPYLRSLSHKRGIALLLIPHAFRHLGLLVLVPGVVEQRVTETWFAHSLAAGDMVAMPLALVAIWALTHEWSSGNTIAWLFSIVGSIDLASAIVNALILPVYAFHLTSFWVVLTCVVPMLLVSQALIFARLAGGAGK